MYESICKTCVNKTIFLHNTYQYDNEDTTLLKQIHTGIVIEKKKGFVSLLIYSAKRLKQKKNSSIASHLGFLRLPM